MTMTDLAILAVLAVVTAVVPPLLLRRHRDRWAIAEATFWIGAVVILGTADLVGADLSERLLFSIAFVARAGLFVGIVLFVERDSLEWSPWRAALFTGLVYVLLVPHVLQTPIDGDEPYFVLIAESIVDDADLDLANQYESLDRSVTGRLDLGPQFGDPAGDSGEMYSRHEPFFPFILIPGLILGGLPATVLTVALLGAALTWSILRLLEDYDLGEASRTIVWPAISLAPPVLFYSVRLWAEVPGALALSESLRAVKRGRWKAFSIWIVVLSLLQLRFALIAASLVLIVVWRERRQMRIAVIAILAVVLPLVAVWAATGRWLGAHQVFELLPMNPVLYLRGMAGLLVDAQAGLLFQAPLWLLALFALLRREDRAAVGPVWIAAIPYLLILLPRSEWHGGWSPPLRYLVVLAPLVAVSLAQARRWIPGWLTAAAGVWTVGLVIHGIAFPWRLFQIASGEGVFGAWMSTRLASDFSRLLPSLIRPNVAAIVWLAIVALAGVLVVRRLTIGARFAAVFAAVAMVSVAGAARQPGAIIHLEDTHVRHEGGELYPELYSVARFRFRGGWAMEAGSAASFRMSPGAARIEYASGEGAVVEIGERRWELPPTEGFASATVELPDSDVVLRLVEGSAIIDRIEHE